MFTPICVYGSEVNETVIVHGIKKDLPLDKELRKMGNSVTFPSFKCQLLVALWWPEEVGFIF